MRSYNSPLKVLSEMEESSVSSLSGTEGSEGADLQYSVTGAVKRNAPASGSTRMESSAAYGPNRKRECATSCEPSGTRPNCRWRADASGDPVTMSGPVAHQASTVTLLQHSPDF
jgi:hypothetical protein